MGMTRTELTNNQIAEILSIYGQNEPFTAIRMTSGFTNVSYLLSVDGTKLILTAMDNHDYESAASVAETMRRISESGLDGPTIVANSDGEHVTQWSGQCLMLKTYCEGKHPDPVSEVHQLLVGRSIAEMHLVIESEGLADQTRRLPVTWKAQLMSCRDLEFVNWIDTTERMMLELGENEDLPVGAVHGDLFPDNILIDAGNMPIIIDWETVSQDVLVFDIAMAIVGFTAGGMRDSSKLLSAYEAGRELEPGERQILPQWCTYSAAVLAFNRYVKNNVKYKGSGNENHYREMFDFWTAIDGRLN